MRLGLGLGMGSMQPAAPSEIAGLTVGGYFVDPSNVPALTTRITFRGDFFFVGSVPNNVLLFTQESTGCDLLIQSTGRMTSSVEDTVGAKMLSSAEVAPAGSITADTWHEIVFDVNHATEQVIITIDGGTPIVTAFTASGTGSFQIVREVSFLATTVGGSAVPSGTRVRNLSVDFNGTLHKAISNNVATANADPWKLGSDFT